MTHKLVILSGASQRGSPSRICLQNGFAHSVALQRISLNLQTDIKKFDREVSEPNLRGCYREFARKPTFSTVG